MEEWEEETGEFTAPAQEPHQRNSYGEQRNYNETKRQHERVFYPTNNEYEKQSNSSDSINVEPNQIKFIIGKRGAKIKEIETACNVKVKIDNNLFSDDHLNIVKLFGSNPKDVSQAKSMILEITEGGSTRSDGNYGTRSSNRESNYDNRSNRESNYDNRSNRESNYDNRNEGKSHNYSRHSNDPDRENNRSGYSKYSDSTRRDEQQTGYSRSSDNRQNNYSRHQDSRNDRYGKSDTYDSNKSYDRHEAAPIDWTKVNETYEKVKHLKWEHLPELRKNFYEEDLEISNLSPEDVEKIRKENNNIFVSRIFEDSTSKDIPNPVMRFDQCFKSYPDLLLELKKQNFKKPSPIQCQAWPVLLQGEDLIGIAQTGTGKTLAFILPAMIHIERQPVARKDRAGPNVLVLAPTRELAIQIKQEVTKYQFRGIKAVCVYGGGDRKEQIETVERGVEIVIATPGRLNDLIEAKVIDVSTITYLVLDEADRMLDMGFEPQIRKILIDIRPDRQTVMTSATWPSSVRRLAQSYMNNPIQVCVGSLNLTAVHTVTQVIEIMEEEEKFERITNFVKNLSPQDKVIIFCGRKNRCDDMASEFTLQGIINQCIHGDREQVDREQALQDIKLGEVQILIATDVASRGIDIDDITYVINYDFPKNIEEYVHRVGRTGRAGRTGTSISYMTKQDWALAGELIPILKEAGEEVPLDLIEMADRFEKMKLRRAAEGGGRGGGRGFGRGGGGGRGSRRY